MTPKAPHYFSTSSASPSASNNLRSKPWVFYCMFLSFLILGEVKCFTVLSLGKAVSRSRSTSTERNVANSMYFQDEQPTPSSTGARRSSSFQDRMKRVLRRQDAASKSKKSPPSESQALIPDITSLQEFKESVAASDTITIVRFYAPWCRACKAMAPVYIKFARKFSEFKFVQVPISSDNASLHQGLGVHSVPFVHVYHPTIGLIEEQKVNRRHLPGFLRQLNDYRLSACSLTQGSDGEWSTESPYGLGLEHSGEGDSQVAAKP